MEILSSIPNFAILVFCFFFCLAILGFLFQKELEEIKEKENLLDNLHVEVSSMKGKQVFLTSHELKKIYYIELDDYDFKHTKPQEKYKLNYTHEGWGRHNIIHNGKKYNLYEN